MENNELLAKCISDYKDMLVGEMKANKANLVDYIVNKVKPTTEIQLRNILNGLGVKHAIERVEYMGVKQGLRVFLANGYIRPKYDNVYSIFE